MPIFLERSEFYKKYSRISIADMLGLHGFMVNVSSVDDEDIVYMEQTKQFLLEKGIVVENVPFKQEFVAEYPLSQITSVYAEGRYKRKHTGEKMYGSYYYYFYKKGFLPKGGIVNQRIYADGVNKLEFLNVFEKQRMMFIEKIGKEFI
jgi:hypothetical protein